MKVPHVHRTLTTAEAMLRWGAPLAGVWLLAALCTLAIAAQSEQLQITWPAAFFLIGSVAMGGITWLVFAFDKRQAGGEARRIPESTLHALSLLGGWWGALLAQRWLRHKSQKPAFQFSAWAGMALHVLVALIVFGWL